MISICGNIKWPVATSHQFPMLPDENFQLKHAEDSNDEAILAKNNHKDKVYHTVASGNQTWLGKAPARHGFFGGCSSYI